MEATASTETTWWLQELWLAACVFPYMFQMLLEFVEENIKEVKERLKQTSNKVITLQMLLCTNEWT